VQDDSLRLRLFFWDSANLALDEGLSIICSAAERPAAGQPYGDTLAHADTFTETNIGSEIAPIYAYEGDLELNTAEMDAALASKATLTLDIDIEIQQGPDTARTTYRFSAQVIRQVYDGSALPTPVAIADFRMVNGLPYWQFPDATWRRLVPSFDAQNMPVFTPSAPLQET
jgi:hypothetical protein